MKYALIIGNNRYDDQKLAQLKTPAADSQALAKVLGDKAIGSFDEVTPLINQTETQVRRAISTFLINKKPDDLVLLYFSGHGILDDRGRLYLALRDTQVNLLKATSIPSSFLADEMDSCRSKRQILVLDCCHSGAFARGTKGEQKAITETTFEGSGFGRVVLTASDSTQYALEGDQVIKQTELSLFTHFLLEGLKTGEADVNNDGHISLDEWYDYTYDKVVSETPRQVPHKWSYNQQGDLIIARNPFVKKRVVELPYELIQALTSSFVGIRESAVSELGSYLRSRDAEMVELAILSLEKMKGDDSRRISSLAAKLLAEFEQARAAVTKPPPPKPTVEPIMETISVISVSPTTSTATTAEIEPAAQRQASRPDVEKANGSAEHPLASPAYTRILFWAKWIGATVLGTAILNRVGSSLYDDGLIPSVVILFCVVAGLVSLMQVILFPNALGGSWIATNAAAAIFLGWLITILNEYNNDWWWQDQFFAVWMVGNLVLGPVLMSRIQEKSRSGSLESPGPNSTIEFMEKGARQNIFTMILSIYLILAALLSVIVVIRDNGLISLPDSLKVASFILYGIAGVFVGISFISKKEIPRNLGFITFAVFAFLDGINAELYAFLGDYPINLFSLLGTLSLISGVFFISQKEIWKNKMIGFMMLSGFLIMLGFAWLDFISYPSLMIAAIFALLAAVYFFRRR
ncbi:MAG: caspase family protein [Chloroflexota bacterium]